jgi:hypothetical protein
VKARTEGVLGEAEWILMGGAWRAKGFAALAELEREASTKRVPGPAVPSSASLTLEAKAAEEGKRGDFMWVL